MRRDELFWVRLIGIAVAMFLSFELSGCSSGAGTASMGGTSALTNSSSFAQTQIQSLNALNSTSNYALTSDDLQTLSNSALLSDGDQQALSQLVQH